MADNNEMVALLNDYQKSVRMVDAGDTWRLKFFLRQNRLGEIITSARRQPLSDQTKGELKKITRALCRHIASILSGLEVSMGTLERRCVDWYEKSTLEEFAQKGRERSDAVLRLEGSLDLAEAVGDYFEWLCQCMARFDIDIDESLRIADEQDSRQIESLLNDYQQRAWSLANHDLQPETAAKVWELGLFCEMGEVGDLLKKAIGHGHPVDQLFWDKLKRELGDVFWYIAAILSQKGVEMAILRPHYSQYRGGWKLEDFSMEGIRIVASFVARSLDKDEIGRDLHLIGGVFSWLCACAYRFDLPLEEVLNANLQKLRDRYGEKFDPAKSLARYQPVDNPTEFRVTEDEARGFARFEEAAGCDVGAGRDFRPRDWVVLGDA